MARLPYQDREDLPESALPIYDRIAETRGSVEPNIPMPNSFRALLNSPPAAEVVGALGEFLRFNTSLDPVIREIAIISVARQTNSDYEWAHHEPVAREVGVSDQVIEAIRTNRAPMGVPAKVGIFAQAAKELVNDGTLSDKTFQAVEHLLGPQGTVELVVLIGYYAMLSTALTALGIEVEPHLSSDLND
ncbi:MAG: carboxymuconolactone decarboxylase family protein [SAR202 cluster bacterium]|jgi:4-carboxymuconolactone decarboxylase|nr:carboxymuconolactone decarboxylase family protein [SAR202 cluster bacterium]